MIVEFNDWDLDNAIYWFNEYKNDDEYKEYLQIEDEFNQQNLGIITFK